MSHDATVDAAGNTPASASARAAANIAVSTTAGSGDSGDSGNPVAAVNPVVPTGPMDATTKATVTATGKVRPAGAGSGMGGGTGRITATVNAGDIARLAGVGRAAVSNWRRRYEDFPDPVGGTTSSPLFALSAVETWLRRNGKSFELSLADRVWQRLRTAVDDLRLGELVACAGAFLLYTRRDPDGWGRLSRSPDFVVRLPHAIGAATADLPFRPETRLEDAGLIRMIADLSRSHGHVEAFEFLCERYVEAHTRRLAVTRCEIAELMARLAAPDGGSVLDPACGIGTLLLAPASRRAGSQSDGRTRLLGQETGETAALITAVRLLLRGAAARVAAGDSLRRDAFPGERVDAVVCDPPFNERVWGHEELIGDPRWDYGVPPRGESELAWVQHCLAHVRPGGIVAILMPAAAASRRSGRRIRGNLLRAGTLRAVITLSSGGPDLWLLRRPKSGERASAAVLLADVADDLSLVEPAWGAYLADSEPPGPSRAVRIIDVLDDEVDLSPARHLSSRSDARDFPAVRDRLTKAATGLAGAPELDVLAEGWEDLPATTIGDLVKAGLVDIRHSALKEADAGDVAVLTVDDLVSGGLPSGWTFSGHGLVTVSGGDIVASPLTARVVEAEGAVLGPHLSLYRVDRDRVDPDFLAGFLRLATSSGSGSRVHLGSSRVDARRARVPRLPLAEQQVYGRAFRDLAALEDALREAAAAGEALVRLGLEGLVDGRLRPRP